VNYLSFKHAIVPNDTTSDLSRFPAKLMLLELNKEFGFKDLGDTPEKVVYFLQQQNIKDFYLEDVLDFLTPDLDSQGCPRFNHAFH
jgi:hypothetical protein